MSNEPEPSLKQVSARIAVEDYARVIQAVDTELDDKGEHIFPDVSAFIRCAIRDFLGDRALNQQYREWANAEIHRNIEKRYSKRAKHRSFMRKILHLF